MAKKSNALLRKLPTYLEMVSDAIVTLKERNGSSQYAIGKFIGDKYKDLPVNFKKMLLIQLKKLVASDKLVKVKASYKLPSTTKIVAAAKLKKGVAPAKKKPTAPAKTKAAPTEAKLASKAKPAAKAKRQAKAKPIRHQQVQTNQPDELAQPETTVVTVEAKYKKQLESFSFEVSTTQTTNSSSEIFIKLKEEIANRFQLKQGCFKLKYKDRDGDIIMLTGEDSLRISVEDFTVLGHQNVIILIVLLA